MMPEPPHASAEPNAPQRGARRERAGAGGRASRPPTKKEWFVYMLRCGSAGALYVGRTTDVRRRYEQHRNGVGARYTRANPPRGLAWYEGGHTASSSAQREAALKKLRHSQKLSLIGAGHTPSGRRRHA